MQLSSLFGWHHWYLQCVHSLDGIDTFQKYVTLPFYAVSISWFCFLINYKIWFANKCSFSIQSYFIGCTFDSFSSSWNERSYTITLLVIAWLIPLIIVVSSHVGILYRIRHAEIKSVNIQKSFQRARNNRAMNREIGTQLSVNITPEKRILPHVSQRVSWNSIQTYSQIIKLLSVYLAL